MAKSWFLTLLIISSLLTLSISPGHGRRIITALRSSSELEEGLGERRQMMQMTTMDYKEPGANTNPRSGLTTPPPSPPSS